MYEARHMQRAIALSRRALEEPGTEPFAAVIVRDGEVVGEGLNHIAARFDPTSHGEVEAIRDACRRLGTVSLEGCELYTSCEPCPLCVAAISIARIGRVYYAASLAQSRGALACVPEGVRRPSDLAAMRREAAGPIGGAGITAEQWLGEDAVPVIAAWGARLSRAPVS